jgi:hypothetical protein
LATKFCGAKTTYLSLKRAESNLFMTDPQESSAPPKGDYQKAEKYINKLSLLAEQDKVEVVHTDLNKFDPGSIQDHYRIDLKDYQIELSHSKMPDSGVDSFVMIFTNFKNVQEGSTEKVILAYTQLTENQFKRFKSAAHTQLERKRREEEDKRFNAAIAPIDQLLEDVPLPDESKTQPLQPQNSEARQEAEPSHNLASTVHHPTYAAHHTDPQPQQAEDPSQQSSDSSEPSITQRADNFYRAVS